MAIIHTYSCDICGQQKRQSNNWFVLMPHKTNDVITATRFDSGDQDEPGVKHCCGVECLMKGVGRWASGSAIAGGSREAA